MSKAPRSAGKAAPSPEPKTEDGHYRIVIPASSDGPRYRKAANTYRLLDQALMLLLPLLIAIGCLSHVRVESGNWIAAVSCAVLALVVGLWRLSLIPGLYESHADVLDAKASGDEALMRSLRLARNPGEFANALLEVVQILALIASAVCFTISVIQLARG